MYLTSLMYLSYVRNHISYINKTQFGLRLHFSSILLHKKLSRVHIKDILHLLSVVIPIIKILKQFGE